MNYQAPVHPKETATATLTTDEQSARRLADCFAEAFFADELAVSLGDAGGGQWCLTVYFRAPIDRAVVRNLVHSAAGVAAGKALRFERVAAKDWVGESLAGLKPVAAGRFVIHGAHGRDRALGRIAIEIEAAQAFGTGHHGSTRGCLLALDGICKAAKARRILDLGTGTGVLAIAAAKSLRRRVLASDADARAVRIARDNARLNGSAPLVRVCHGTGIDAAAIRAAAPFDLVFANILLAPLQRLAAPLTGIVPPGGRLILSGLLNAQANAARSAYPHFSLERCIAVDGWTTLVLRRNGSFRKRASRVDPPLSGEGKVSCR